MKKKITFFIYKRRKLDNLSIVLIFAKYNKKWLLCRHKDRISWEVPGGHIESGEDCESAARRELYEESGAIPKRLKVVAYIMQKNDFESKHGAIYFADIKELKKLPEYEMSEIRLFDEFPKNTTYTETYEKIFKSKVLDEYI